MTIDLATLEANRRCPFGGGCHDCPCNGNCNHLSGTTNMIEDIVTDANGQRWRVKAKSMKAALDEIAHARCTGSIGSRLYDNTRCGGGIELIAKVHKIDVNGNDVQPS